MLLLVPAFSSCALISPGIVADLSQGILDGLLEISDFLGHALEAIIFDDLHVEFAFPSLLWGSIRL